MQALTTVIQMKDQRGNVIGEKEVATYTGLLSRAHEEELESIATALIQVPSPDNGMTAVCAATVKTKRGTFTGIGDANPDNVNRKIVPHIIRMAETRAKARALRDAVNIGVVCLEELGGAEGEDIVEDDRPPARDERPRDNVREFQRREANDRGASDRRAGDRSDNRSRQGDGARGQGRTDAITDAQRRMLLRLLADRGIEGEQAVEEICRKARVDRIGDIPKRQASQLIDDLQGRDRA
jgi:hypothetical protein